MKLTSKHLKKLILEVLKEKYDYSSEEAENIKALAKYKKAKSSGVSQRIGKCLVDNKEYAEGESDFSFEDQLCLEEQGYTRLGLGSFRIVFADNKNKERVVKFALKLSSDKGISMNNKEADLRLQTLSPMFPKVYNKHPDGIWIEAERINIFKFKKDEEYFGPESWAPIKKFFPSFSASHEQFGKIKSDLQQMVPDLISKAAGQRYTLDDVYDLLPFGSKPLDEAFMIPDIHSSKHSIADKESSFVAAWSLLIVGSRGLKGKSPYEFLYDNIIDSVRFMISEALEPKEEESSTDDDWFDDFVFENLEKNKRAVEEAVYKVEKYLEPRLQSAYKLITSDPTYQELLRVHSELGGDFQLWDLRPDNLGSAMRDGKETLVLIDPGFDMDSDPRN